MAHKVAFHPIAESDLFGLYDYIETRSGPTVAARYVDRIEALGLSLSAFPQRGVERPDLGLLVRTVAMGRRVQMVYRVTADTVEILRVLYAGRDLGPDDLPH